MNAQQKRLQALRVAAVLALQANMDQMPRPLSRPCPTCGAVANQPCRSRSGAQIVAHAARFR